MLRIQPLAAEREARMPSTVLYALPRSHSLYMSPNTLLRNRGRSSRVVYGAASERTLQETIRSQAFPRRPGES